MSAALRIATVVLPEPGPPVTRRWPLVAIDLLLPFTELHQPGPPCRHRQLQRLLLARYPRARPCKPPSASCRRSAAIRESLPPCTARENRRCPRSPSSIRNICPTPHGPRFPAAGISPAGAGGHSRSRAKRVSAASVVFFRTKSSNPVSSSISVSSTSASIRRFRAKPDKKIVDGQAAGPSSWKTPFIATCMVW